MIIEVNYNWGHLKSAWHRYSAFFLVGNLRTASIISTHCQATISFQWYWLYEELLVVKLIWSIEWRLFVGMLSFMNTMKCCHIPWCHGESYGTYGWSSSYLMSIGYIKKQRWIMLLYFNGFVWYSDGNYVDKAVANLKSMPRYYIDVHDIYWWVFDTNYERACKPKYVNKYLNGI